MSTPLLLTGATVLTMNSRHDVFEGGCILSADGRVAYVGARSGVGPLPPGCETLDLSGHIALPGLVNTHTHLPMSLFRGLADDLPLKQWLEKHMFPAEAATINPLSVQTGTRLSVAEMLLSGTTCCADGYFCENSVREAATQMGLRGVFAQGIIDFPAPGVPDPSTNIDVAKTYLESTLSPAGSRCGAVFAHSPYTCSADTLRRAKQVARAYGALFFIHAAETRWEVSWARAQGDGLTPIKYLDSLGLLDTRTVLIHAVHVDESEQDLIAERDAAVSINTESNMKLGSGVAPLSGYLARGVRIGLGTDGCASNNDLDMFAEMGHTARLHTLETGNPAALSARDVLETATGGGARVLGLDREIGSLEPGKLADIIAVSTDRPHAVPLYNPYSHLVHSASGADVDTVVIGGELLVRNGSLTGVDLDAVLDAANRLAPDIAAFSTA